MSILGVPQILAQFALLVLTGAGWGFWVAKLSGKNALSRPEDWLLCGIAGVCACCLFLQNLVYADVRLAWSTWVAVAIAGGGLLGIWRNFISKLDRTSAKQLRRGLSAYVALGLGVFGFQGAALLYHGPHNYYGNAHGDQINYVLLGQFLVEKPISTDLPDVGLHPWLVKAIDLKAMRIGQSVMNGYVATSTLTDVKATYGTTSVFFVALLAVTVLMLLRSLGVNPRFAWLGALWAGILPAVTVTQLDGFFSQTCIFFVLPAIAVAILAARRDYRLAFVATALLLAFLLGTYTEIYVLGLALTVSLALVAFGLAGRQRLGFVAGCTVGSLLLLAPYSASSIKFMLRQYGVATNPLALATLFPTSGTWVGWTEIFFAVPADNPLFARLAILGALLVLGLIVAGLFSRSLPRLLQLAVLAGLPASIFALLLSAPVFFKYTFAKLVITFSPFVITLAVLGVARAELLATFLTSDRKKDGRTALVIRPRRVTHWVGYSFLVLLLAASARSSWRAMQIVIEDQGILLAVDSPQARATYRELESHPERQYLLKEQHTILNAWLCYHGRKSDMYTDVSTIGDRPIPTDQFAFSRLPRDQRTIWFLTGNGVRSYANPRGTPEIIVRNPQGHDQLGMLVWYWVGDAMEFELVSFNSTSAKFTLGFFVLCGPANPSPDRTVSLHDKQTGQKQSRSFTSEARLEFPVQLQPGSNTFELHVDDPTEWVLHVPADPRKHMLRVQEVSLFNEHPTGHP